MKYLIAMLLITGTGCATPGFRDEVRDTGEGTVTVEHVPVKTPATPPAPAKVQTQQQQIDALQAQVQQLSVENQKLKATTSPVKD